MSLIMRAALVFIVGVFAVDRGSAQESTADDNSVRSQRYRVSPNFNRAPNQSTAGGQGAVDPFAPGDPGSGSPPQSNNTIQQTLIDDLGIEFPEGTYARINGESGELEIRHHPAILRAIEIYLNEINQPYAVLGIRVEIFQMPNGDALRVQR